MVLALFDLDHTLLPLDSDHAWGEFLVRRGKVDAEAYAQANDRFYGQYRDGSLDINAYLRFALEPLGRLAPDELVQLHAAFMDEVIEAAVLPQALALVRMHQERGAVCVLITATNEFVTAPIAQRFGIEHLIACQVEQREGRYTGQPAGIASFREGKLQRLIAWLDACGALENHNAQTLDRILADAVFYSDSWNDLPLLSRVGHPVATNADERLRAHALRLGWQTLDLFTPDAQDPLLVRSTRESVADLLTMPSLAPRP